MDKFELIQLVNCQFKSINYNVSYIFVYIGLCTSEGATECCETDCQGQPNDCYCDESCLTFRDCCRDIYKFTSCGSSMSL